ncbi:MAG: thermonuclease family protein [Acidimicrobiia bacterium]
MSVAVLTGCSAGPAPAVTPGDEVGTTTEAEVTWVVDGDTIEVAVSGGQITVRLLAINAPDDGECFADDGLDHLIETLKGRRVSLETFGEDQYGRALAHVFMEDRHVNVEMVEMGLALASTPGEGDPYRDEILEAEQVAFEGGMGLWSAAACGSRGLLPQVVIDPELSVIDAAGPDDQNLSGETLDLVNEGADAVDTSGWILRDESSRHRFVFPLASRLERGERLRVASDDPGWDPGASPVWNNDGDMALLQMPDGTVVSRWRY